MIKKDPEKKFPEFYVACGLQDVLLEANRSIAKALEEAGADVTYEEGEGFHDCYFWDTYIQHVLKWLNYSAQSKEKDHFFIMLPVYYRQFFFCYYCKLLLIRSSIELCY
ncbi:MAG: hypothetical protein IJH14_11240 [Solobacterium sp.]|nr:hypothetical protein [Solobacterium sp.]